jgi:hypothetical protein
MFAEKQRVIRSVPGARTPLGSLLKDRLLGLVKWLSAPPAPHRESPVWQADPVIDPADFSGQLISLQNSLYRANHPQPQIKAGSRIDN